MRGGHTDAVVPALLVAFCLCAELALPQTPPASQSGSERAVLSDSSTKLHFDVFLKGLAAYQNGDYDSAYSSFYIAATMGVAGAQSSLGRLYTEGKGVKHDPVEAAKWYRRAADQGLDSAQHWLGAAYHTGVGVPQNHREAVKWFRLAALQDYPPAQLLLGVCYDNGHGVQKDVTEVVKWYRLAAEQGSPGGQLFLALKYAVGEGVPKDYIQAHMWANLATAAGVPDGEKTRDLLARSMTPAQLEEAQRRAAEWRPRGKAGPEPPR